MNQHKAESAILDAIDFITKLNLPADQYNKMVEVAKNLGDSWTFFNHKHAEECRNAKKGA